ncbi:xylulose kinase-1 [Tanacetum coccineum]
MSTQLDIYVDRAERLAKTHDLLALMENTQTPFHLDQPSHITYMQHPQPHNNYVQQPPFNTNYVQQPMPNPEDISDPTTTIDMALVLMAKAFNLNNTTPTNNNQRSSSNPRDMQIAQPGMNMDQDRHMLMVEDNVGNQFRPNAGQIAGNQNGYNALQNVGNLVGQNAVQNLNIQKIANQNVSGNVVAARAEGNGNGSIENQIRCYNCQRVGHCVRNCIVRPMRRDAAYLQTRQQIAQKEEAGIQLQPKEFDFMAASGACEEIKEVNANCTLMENLLQASTSSTQTDKAPFYDSDRSAEVHQHENYSDNEIFNMFTQDEQYTDLLEFTTKPHLV